MNVVRSAQLGHALVLCTCALVLSGCGKAKGVAAVEELCARNGGMRVFQTTYVDGYLTSDDDYFCRLCIELLGDGKFAYMDAYVTQLKDEKGRYFRYSVGNQGDDACEDWVATPVDAKRLLRQLDIREDQCIVVEELSERPAGVVLSQQWRMLVHDGITVRLNIWTLTDERSDTLLAQIKDYQFTSEITRLLDMSGGGGNPDARCLTPDAYGPAVSMLTGLNGELMRDPAER